MLVQIPVEARVDEIGPVRPQVGVGQSAGEHLLADLSVADPGLEFDRTESERPLAG